MRGTLEKFVESARFSMRALYNALWPLIEDEAALTAHLSALRQRLGPRDYAKLGVAIIRHVFLIELVKVPAIETTKYRVRWFSQLEGDQRQCTFEECFTIASTLLEELGTGWLDTPDHLELVRFCHKWPLLPYEAPLDYHERPEATDSETRIHRLGNLRWTSDEMMLRTLRLRKYLCDPATSPDALFFRSVLNDKIKVKTYLTDRVLTGTHKTNREKRWEVHPHSVHFALRRTAMAIEYALVTQLCAFEGFPECFKAQMQVEGILPADLPTFRCPITLEPMSFAAFKEQLSNPTHGKSEFQVGHRNPLKLEDPSDTASGHTADNITWMSAHGNRIQGHMSLSAVRALLRQIARNYEALGLT